MNSQVVSKLDPAAVGALAAKTLTRMETHPSYDRLTTSSMRYSDCWASFTGYPTVSQWSLERDAGPLLVEALRVLALKAAVFELTGGDEDAAELLVPGAIDEMIHAVLAQFTVMTTMQSDLGVRFPHATELEEFTYTRGCMTDVFYAAAGWGEQPTRYWLDAAEVTRRLGILNEAYGSAGVAAYGRSHNINFDAAAPRVTELV